MSEKPREQDIVEQLLPKEADEPIELQVTDFRRRLAKVLDDVLTGQRYIISSHSTPKALLRLLTKRAPTGASTVMRKEFESGISGYLNEVQSGKIMVVCSAKSDVGLQEPQPKAVIAQQVPKRIVEKRLAQIEEKCRESGRTRMQKVRKRRRAEEDARQADLDAKLRAIEGMSLEDIIEARRLLTAKKCRILE